jgi:hypothetical protein
MRIAYLSTHPGLVYGEVRLLKEMGHEIYLPIVNKQIEEVEAHRNIQLSEEKMRSLDSYNPFSENISNEIIDIFVKEFDMYFVTGLSIPFVLSIASHTQKPFLIRIFGRESNHNYNFITSKIKHFPNVWCGMAYEEMLEVEPEHTRHKFIYLPLPENYSFDSLRNTHKNTTRKLMFVCSYIDESSYYKNIYLDFKKNFGDLPHAIYGRQCIFENNSLKELGTIVKSDANIYPNCPAKEYQKAFQEYSVLFYHSVESRHVHYHPIEAVTVGMPVVFMEGCLFDSLTDKKSSGRCKDTQEARRKVERLLQGDTELAQRIMEDNSVILTKISKENYKNQFEKILLKLLPN